MAFTLFRQWLETHSFRSDKGLVRVQRRISKRLVNEVSVDVADGKKIKLAFDKGEREAIEKAWTEYAKLLTKEQTQLQSIVINHKILLNRHLDALVELEKDIIANPQQPNKEELMKQIRDMEHSISVEIEGLLRNFTSFDNTNLSAKKLLDRSSQIRDMLYKLQQSSDDVKLFDKNIDLAKKDEANKKTASKQNMDVAISELKKNLAEQTEAIADAFLLLQELEADYDDKKKFIDEAEKNQFYPHPWAEDDRKIILGLDNSLKKWLHDEIAEGRIFISKVQRAM